MRDKHKIVREVVISSRVAELADAVAGVLGKHATYRASGSDMGTPRLFIPSAVEGLDQLLDRRGRGWPVGRIIEVYGDEATAKTALGLQLIAQCQRMGGDGILYPCEGEYDEWLAKRCGVDLTKLVLGDSSTVEGVFGSFHEALRRVGRTGLLVAVIDSIAAMNTEAELQEFEETGVIRRDRSAQIRALMLSNALAKVSSMVPRVNAILLCINQVRTNPDVLFGDGKQPPGGKALKFYSSIRLRLDAVGKYKRQVRGVKRVVGMKVRATLVKNRLAKPYQELLLLLDYDRGLGPLPKKKQK